MKKTIQFFLIIFLSVSLFSIDLTEGLVKATTTGDKELIQQLLDQGADINEMNEIGITPLVMAVIRKQEDLIPFLLERGANPLLTTASGISPLQLAQSSQNELIYYTLLDALLRRQGNGYSYLSTLILQDKQDEFLTAINLGMDVNAPDREGATPLMYASHTNQIFYAEHLLAQGAQLNQQDDDGNTPLTIAQKAQNSEMIDFLTQKGATN